MPPRLTDAAGWPVRLDRQLAAGGEGTIWIPADRPDRLAKVYHHPLPEDDADKLRVLTGRAVPDLTDHTGWPIELLFSSGLVAGFVMPRFLGVVPIQQLYNPARRRRHFPRADWSFLIRTAARCAELFDAIHRASCVIADVNQSNLLVAPDGRVVLVDCDSFQVHEAGRVFACHVGVPDYTAPELQGRDFHNLLRTENHDAFGLAVLIFQILMQGRHPFAGIWRGDGEMPLERAIRDGRFVYGGAAATPVDRPPYTLALEDLSTEIAALFERAFGRFQRRPMPRDWANALEVLQAELQSCPSQPGHCYVAARPECPWCGIVRSGGPDYFADAAPEPVTFAVDRIALNALSARIEGEPLDAFAYDRARLAPAAMLRPLPAAANTPDAIAPSFIAIVVLGLTYLVAAVGTTSALTIGLPITLIGSLGWWLRLNRSVRAQEKRIRRQALREAETNLVSPELEWRQIETGSLRLARELEAQLRHEIREIHGLESLFRTEVRRLNEHHTDQARVRFLQSQFVAKGGIVGLSASQVQLLATFGVETAFDIEEWRLFAIRGISEKLAQALLDWKRDVTAQFRAGAVPHVPEGGLNSLCNEFQQRQKLALDRLAAGANEFESLVCEIRAKLPGLAARLRPLVAHWQQSKADYSVFLKVAN